jgi:hypothetical protein
MPAELVGGHQIAFSAAGAQIAGALRWEPAGQVSGQVNLEGVTADELEDRWSSLRPNGFWPTGGQLRLDGFTYRRIGGHPEATVGQRLDWIRSQYRSKPTVLWVETIAPPVNVPARDGAESFASQPYAQLAAVYRGAGRENDARKVAIARRVDLRKHGTLNSYRKAGNWLLDKTIKYGYQSWRAGVGLVAVFVVFWVLSLLAQQHNVIAPVGDIDSLHLAPSATRCTDSYPCFSPSGYTIDTVIPIISVHQAEFWGPDASVPWGRLFVLATWLATGLGWALATLLVAGYTGLVRQD